MEIGHMREFIELAGCLNFNKAANELFISQPTLTRHIGAIEEEMGARLLERSSHSVELTPCGKLAFEYFENIVDQFDELQARVQSPAAPNAAEVSVGTLYYGFAHKYSYPLFNLFKKRCPNIKLAITSAKPTQITDMLKNGEIDVGITLASRFQKDECFEYHQIAKERLCAIVSPAHGFAGRQSVSPADLSNESILMMHTEKMLETHLRTLFDYDNISIGNVSYTEHIDTVVIALKEADCVFIGTALLSDLAQRDLKFIPIESEGFYLDVSLLRLKKNKNPEAAKIISCAKSIAV